MAQKTQIPGYKKERIFSMVIPPVREYLRRIGNGNISAGIQILVLADMERNHSPLADYDIAPPEHPGDANRIAVTQTAGSE